MNRLIVTCVCLMSFCVPFGAGGRKIADSPLDDSVLLTIDTGQGTPLNFRLVQSGSFRMGDEAEAKASRMSREIREMLGQGSTSPIDAIPLRHVTISRPFYFLETKVTTEQYCAFLNDVPDAHKYIGLTRWARIQLLDGKYVPLQGLERAAINTVPFEAAQEYCRWLSRKSRFSCRLPTEAEWEWAARGSEGRIYPWGDVYDPRTDYGYDAEKAVASGSHIANRTPEGLFDMVGPVAEWCTDFYTSRYDAKETLDPKGPPSGLGHVLRGRGVEASDREWQPGGTVGVQGFFGFRVLLETSRHRTR